MFKKYILLAVIGGLILLPIKSFAGENVTHDQEMQHQTSDNHSEKEDHDDHETFVVPGGELIPTVKLIVHKDSKRGWNLEIQVTNFTFTPEQVNQESKYNEGHAHIYVNGKKLTRLYGNWYYLNSLPSGKNEIKVSLNTNNHENLISEGKMIEDTIIITVP